MRELFKAAILKITPFSNIDVNKLIGKINNIIHMANTI